MSDGHVQASSRDQSRHHTPRAAAAARRQRVQIADHDGNAKHQSSSSMPPHVHSTKAAPNCMRCCRILAAAPQSDLPQKTSRRHQQQRSVRARRQVVQGTEGSTGKRDSSPSPSPSCTRRAGGLAKFWPKRSRRRPELIARAATAPAHRVETTGRSWPRPDGPRPRPYPAAQTSR